MDENKYSQGWKPGCLALDFDDVQINKVKEEINRLQKKYRLGDAHIYRTSEDSYHVYFFRDTYFSRKKERKIINEAEGVDPEFKEWQDKRDKTRMRIRGKHDRSIEKVDTIKSDYDGHGLKQEAEHLKRTFERLKQ